MPEDQIFNPDQKQDLDSLAEAQPAAWKNFIRRNKLVILIVASVLVAGLVAAFFILNREEAVDPVSNNVVLLIKGPSQISSGNEGEFRVVYRNGENADLTELTLEMFYPTGFQFKSASPAPTSSNGSRFNLPILKQGEDGEIKIMGRLSGATAEDKLLRTKLTYKLSNFNSEFSVEADFHSIILAPSLTLDITGPVDVINGQDSTFSVVYGNVAGQDFDNLALELHFPEGFAPTTSNPQPTRGKNYWTIGKLTPGQGGRIDLTGTFTGESQQEKMVVAELGQVIGNNFAPQVLASTNFKIVPSSLFVKITSEPGDIVSLGQIVEFNLEYGNQGDVGMTNVVISLTLDSVVLDLSRLSVYDAIVAGNVITWKSATLSNLNLLSPSQRGEITFTVPVKNSLASNLKNPTIKAHATISSDQFTKSVKSNDLELKLASQLNLSVLGEYVSGSLPMQVGQPTLFSLTFLVSNLSNDLEGTTITASLPLPASAWKNVIVPEAEKERLSYDPNSGKIIWNIGNLPAFAGKFTPAPAVTFQLEVVPAEGDRGRSIKLLSEVKATGKDTFINQDISSSEIREVDTSNLDDEMLNQKGTIVQ